MRFGKINEIDINDESSWEDVIFLTFDLDWCSDEVLSFTIDLIEEKDIAATWFITHNSDILKKLHKNPKFELGIHPNFNFLLDGNYRFGRNSKEIIEYYKKIVPEAVSVRAHSLTQSSKISDEYMTANFKFECNFYIPHFSCHKLVPWRFFNGQLLSIPHSWEDDINCSYNYPCWDINKIIDKKGLKVLLFHPTNLFLNCSKKVDYIEGKPFILNFKKMSLLREKNLNRYGENAFLLNLIDQVLTR